MHMTWGAQTGPSTASPEQGLLTVLHGWPLSAWPKRPQASPLQVAHPPPWGPGTMALGGLQRL